MLTTSSMKRPIGGGTTSSTLLFFFLSLVLDPQHTNGSNNITFPPKACPTKCAKLSNVSFPFGTNQGCGAPDFRLNCSTTTKDNHADDDIRPIWNPPDKSPYNRSFFLSHVFNQEPNLSRGSALVSLSSSSLPPPSPNNSSPCSHLWENNELFNISSLVEMLTTPGANWVLSPDTTFLFLGCSPNPDTLAPAGATACNSSYNSYRSIMRGCRPTQTLCYITTVVDSALSLAQTGSCEYFTSFVKDNNNYYNANNSLSMIAIQWSVDEKLARQCLDCGNNGSTCGVYGANELSCLMCQDEGVCQEVPPHLGSRSPSPSPSPGPSSSNMSANHVTPKQSGALLLISLGVAGAGVTCLVGILFLSLVLWRRRMRWSRFHRRNKSYGGRSSSSKELLQTLAEQVGPVPTKLYTYEELRHATGSFSDTNLLGDGGFGTVYEARLPDATRVAVKRLYHNNYRNLEQFVNEIRILSCLHHPFLIKLLGFCYQHHHDLLLVYEFASNGTLADHLHNNPGSLQADTKLKASGMLTWQMRLRVSLETAQALEYLHFAVDPPIFHRDVKSSNILLDEDFHVRLADFGLSRLLPFKASHVATAPQGTPGYVDPDYENCYQLSDKSDVYSFGVVLMEIVSGQMAVDMGRERRDMNLSQMALSKIQKGALEELIDPRLHVEVVRGMVYGVAELAFRCLADDKDDRPTMKEVVVELARIESAGYPINPTVKQPSPPLSPTSVQTRWSNSTDSPDPAKV